MCPAPGESAGAAVSQSRADGAGDSDGGPQEKSLFFGRKVRPGCVLLEDSPAGAKGAAGAGQRRWHKGRTERHNGSPSLGIVCPAKRRKAAKKAAKTRVIPRSPPQKSTFYDGK